MTDSPAPFGPTYGFGVYIHWPYCARICPYCDFNVYAAKARDTQPLVHAILADLKAQARALPGHPQLTSIFLGGGTPSLMAPDDMAALITACDQTFGLATDCEITLEANPNNVTKALASEWKAAGIGRLSIGLQSLDDEALAFLGRDHTSSDARAAVAIAAEIFSSFSIDMIYARPGQTLKEWERELTAALALSAPHLSLYELTIAPATAFGKAAARGTLEPLPDDTQATLYELTDALTRNAGMPAYEVSNHASGPAHQARHNLTYWQSGDWLGLGPGAHGRLTVNGRRRATEAIAKPDAYIHAMNAAQSSASTKETLSPEDALHEFVTMGLRPASGLDPARMETLMGKQPDPDTLARLETGKWLTVEPGRLALTAKGRLLADRIALELVT